MFDAFVFMLLYYKDPAGTCLLCVQTTIRSFKLVVNRPYCLPEILAAGPGSGTATGSRRRRNVNVAATRGAAGG
jgi:hypothetical protein